MKLNKTPNPLNRDARNKENDNWQIIEDSFNNVVNKVSEEAFEKVIDGSKIDWEQMVDTVEDLPEEAAEGEARGVKSDNKIYRFNGTDWVPIAEINLNPITEVDQRLTSQLAETDDNIHRLKGWELNSKQRSKKAFTVFRSDDGNIAEWTIARDIFNQKGVPQTIAIISDWVGRDGYLSKEQLLTLQNVDGWEILSHSKTHPTTSGGRTMIPDLPENEARHEILQSKIDLENMGLRVESYAHVAGQYRTRDRKITRDYYRAAMISRNGEYGGLNKIPIETHELKAFWVDPSTNPLLTYLNQYDKATAIQMTLDRAFEAIDNAHNEGGIVIIGTHFRYIDDSDYVEMYEDLIDYAKSKTSVTTLRDALNQTGNIVEIGDFSKHSTGDKVGGSHFVIGSDGTVDGGLYVADQDAYNSNTRWKDFPNGLTICAISPSNAEGFPGAGILLNHKSHSTSFGYNYQEFRMYRNSETYYRYVGASENYSEWQSEKSVHFDDAVTHLTKISDFKNGITHTQIREDSSEMPFGEPGTLVTHKLRGSDPWGMNYQEYTLNFRDGLPSFIRRAIDATTWTNWYPISATFPDQTRRKFSEGITAFNLGTTYTPVGSGHAEASLAPEGKPGLLITHRATTGAPWGMNYQEFQLNFESDLRKYKRRAVTETSWTDWVMDGS